VPLRTVFASLAEGATVDEILEDGPPLAERGIRAAIAFAGQDDAVVWQASQAGRRPLVTQDLDFSDVRK
jgi:uncharacterized protein (DUF433 family)